MSCTLSHQNLHHSPRSLRQERSPACSSKGLSPALELGPVVRVQACSPGSKHGPSGPGHYRVLVRVQGGSELAVATSAQERDNQLGKFQYVINCVVCSFSTV